MTHSIERSVDVEASSVETFRAWVRLDELRRFLPAVRRLARVAPNRVRWSATLAGREIAGEAEIVELVPGRRIVWRSQTGLLHAGAILFQPLTAERTRILFRIEYEPVGLAQNVARVLGIVNRAVWRGLERAKRHVEERPARAARTWSGGVVRGGA